MIAWMWIVGGIVAIILVFWLTFRSLRRWQQPPPGRSPEAQQAEARLWSTKGLEQNR